EPKLIPEGLEMEQLESYKLRAGEEEFLFEFRQCRKHSLYTTSTFPTGRSQDGFEEHPRICVGVSTQPGWLMTSAVILFNQVLFFPGDDPSKGTSKLAPVQRYQWGHSMLGTLATEMSDSWFEALNLIDCMAMWLSKHAAWVAGKDDVRDYEAKECLTCLRRAAGMFSYVGTHIGRLSGTGDFEGA
ncbi:hypothetical protein GCK32_016507, partial [Trichostrongylus colubriformis]